MRNLLLVVILFVLSCHASSPTTPIDFTKAMVTIENHSSQSADYKFFGDAGSTLGTVPSGKTVRLFFAPYHWFAVNIKIGQVVVDLDGKETNHIRQLHRADRMTFTVVDVERETS